MTLPANGTRQSALLSVSSRAGGVALRTPLRAVDVLIVDDYSRASYSVWALLRWQHPIRVSTSDGADAVAAVQRGRPAVCLVSAALGPRAIHRLTELAEAPRVLVYADRRTADLEGIAVIAGPDGVVWRYGDPEVLAKTITRVAAGHERPSVLPSRAIDRLIDYVEDRDRPIAAMLLLRTPVDEIARTLGISARALRVRRCELVRRLEPTARDLAQVWRDLDQGGGHVDA